MSDNEFKQFLVSELEKNIGLTTIDAVRDAESMIDGKRKVIDGEYVFWTMKRQIVFLLQTSRKRMATRKWFASEFWRSTFNL